MPFEYTILSGAAMIFMAVGFFNYQTMWGLFAGIAGGCVFFAMIVMSIRNRKETGHSLAWNGFRVCPFLFMLLFGITIGLVTTEGILGTGIGMKVCGSVIGLIIGYLTGIYAGFWLQLLGWIRPIIEVVLVPIMIGLAVVSVLFLIA